MVNNFSLLLFYNNLCVFYPYIAVKVVLPSLRHLIYLVFMPYGLMAFHNTVMHQVYHTVLHCIFVHHQNNSTSHVKPWKANPDSQLWVIGNLFGGKQTIISLDCKVLLIQTALIHSLLYVYGYFVQCSLLVSITVCVWLLCIAYQPVFYGLLGKIFIDDRRSG